MPRYIIERDTGTLTMDQLRAAGFRSNAVLAGMPEVVWIKSYVSDAECKIYCEYDVLNAGAVLDHARSVGLLANCVSEVSLEISPAMFM